MAILVGTRKMFQNGIGLCARECHFQYTNLNENSKIFCAKSDGTTEQRVMWYSVLTIHMVMLTTIIFIAVFVQNKIGRETCPYRRKAKDATRELVFIYIK